MEFSLTPRNSLLDQERPLVHEFNAKFCGRTHFHHTYFYFYDSPLPPYPIEQPPLSLSSELVRNLSNFKPSFTLLSSSLSFYYYENFIYLLLARWWSRNINSENYISTVQRGFNSRTSRLSFLAVNVSAPEKMR